MSSDNNLNNFSADEYITVELPQLDLEDLNLSHYDYIFTSGGPNITINSGAPNVTINSVGTNGAVGSTAFHSTVSNNSPNSFTIGSSLSSSDWRENFYVGNDLEVAGNITWQGKNLGQLLSKIESRLAILTADPEKLSHFAALQKAYQNYKTLEALCEMPKPEDDQ